MVIRILIAEHEEAVRKGLESLVQSAFSAQGYTVEISTVDSVYAALDAIRSTLLSLVITDWVWPAPVNVQREESSAGAQIAATAARSHVPVLVVTSRVEGLEEASRDDSVDAVIHWDQLAVEGTAPLTAFINSHIREDGKDRNMRDIFIVYGHDREHLKGLKAFLKDIGLNPIDFDYARELTLAKMRASNRPLTTYDVITYGTSVAGAVLVLLSPDERATLAASPDESEVYRPRPNVIFEAGLAYARQPERTLLVLVEGVSTWSDVDGIQWARYPKELEDRRRLIGWLEGIGAPVNARDEEWRNNSY